MDRLERLEKLSALSKERIIILDGAMGTELQTFTLEEDDFRGERFAGWNCFLKGNNDLLNLTKPDVVKEVHRRYFLAGADIAETNTFSATTIAQADYQMESLAAEIAREGAKLAREVADEFETEDSPKAVWAAIGPTNKTLSLSPNVNDPGFREVTFEDVRKAYYEQIDAMAEFADVFLIETIFDTLNAKAAIKAVKDWEHDTGQTRPMVLSGTITDASGRTLSGQTTDAFWHSVRHAKPWAVGLNCALGADMMRQYVVTLSRIAETRVLAYPNAGLPNEFGEYDVTPAEQAEHLKGWANEGIVNVLGGCCGTRPAHIEAITKAVKSSSPRELPSLSAKMKLSGLEPFEVA